MDEPHCYWCGKQAAVLITGQVYIENEHEHSDMLICLSCLSKELKEANGG